MIGLEYTQMFHVLFPLIFVIEVFKNSINRVPHHFSLVNLPKPITPYNALYHDFVESDFETITCVNLSYFAKAFSECLLIQNK